MDRERNKAMRDDTIFRIYSMTKPITSVALMMLWEEGRFQLTDPVHRFIPSWRDQRVWQEGAGEEMVTRRPASPVTMQHILSHTAGLTYGGLLPGMETPVDDVYKDLGVARGGGETLLDFADKLGAFPCCTTRGSAGATHWRPMCVAPWLKSFHDNLSSRFYRSGF